MTRVGAKPAGDLSAVPVGGGGALGGGATATRGVGSGDLRSTGSSTGLGAGGACAAGGGGLAGAVATAAGGAGGGSAGAGGGALADGGSLVAVEGRITRWRAGVSADAGAADAVAAGGGAPALGRAAGGGGGAAAAAAFCSSTSRRACPARRRLANLAYAAQLLDQAPGLLAALMRQLFLWRSLRGLWRCGGLRRLGSRCRCCGCWCRLGRGGLTGQQLLGLGPLRLRLLDQAACLLGEVCLLRRGAHLVGLAAGTRQHLCLIRAAPLGSMARILGRLGCRAPLGLGGLACGFRLLAGFLGLALGLALGGGFGGEGLELLGLLHFAVRLLLLGFGAVRGAGELLGHFLRGIVGTRRHRQCEHSSDPDNRAARNRPCGHCLLLT